MLASNLQVLNERWPEIASRLESCATELSVEPTEGRAPTVSVDGLQLSSAYDPSREASIQASLIPTGTKRATVYGIGAGHLVANLLDRTDLESLELVLMHPEVAKASLSHFEYSSWLADERLELTWAKDSHALKPPFAVVPPCLTLAEQEAHRLRDLLILQLVAPQANQQSANRFDWVERAELIEPWVERDGDVESLFDSARGETLIVIGGGPSTDAHWDEVRAEFPDAKLVAVNTVLANLAKREVVPDVVVAMDPKEWMISQLATKFPSGSASKLVYFPSVLPDALEAWQGERLASYAEPEIHFLDLASRYPRGSLETGGSVSHSALALAVKMGAKRILLLGMDFGYPGGKVYADGVEHKGDFDGNTNRRTLMGTNGEPIETTLVLIGHLRWTEGFIERNKEVRFDNVSKIGARIEGAGEFDGAS